jgi:hypothetical protein
VVKASRRESRIRATMKPRNYVHIDKLQTALVSNLPGMVRCVDCINTYQLSPQMETFWSPPFLHMQPHDERLASHITSPNHFPLPTRVEIRTASGSDVLFPSDLVTEPDRMQSTIQYLHELASFWDDNVEEGYIVLVGPVGAIAAGEFKRLIPGDCVGGKEMLICAPLETFFPGRPSISFLLGMNREGLLYIGTGDDASMIIRQLLDQAERKSADNIIELE